MTIRTSRLNNTRKGAHCALAVGREGGGAGQVAGSDSTRAGRMSGQASAAAKDTHWGTLVGAMRAMRCRICKVGRWYVMG